MVLFISLKYKLEREEVAAELKSESQSDDVNVMFFDYLVSAYDSFMANDDETYTRLDEELADTFRERDETIIQEPHHVLDMTCC